VCEINLANSQSPYTLQQQKLASSHCIKSHLKAIHLHISRNSEIATKNTKETKCMVQSLTLLNAIFQIFDMTGKIFFLKMETSKTN
jgi:hypothetical protein